MKIVRLEAENIKRLVAVDISPEGNLVEITGRNGQGKTSVLDSIWWALAGTANIQDRPIRKGENQAWIRLDLGELVVTRTFRTASDGEYTTSIKVESAEGAKFPSPQTMIDGLLGQMAFDPLAFARMDAKGQVEALRRFVPGFDFDAADAANARDYAARTNANRVAKEARTRAAGILVPPGTPEEEIDLAEMMKAAGNAVQEAIEIDAEASRRGDVIMKANELERKIAVAQASLKAMRAEIDGWGPLPAKTDPDAARNRLMQAEATNRNVRALKQRAALLAEARKAEADALAFTAAMDARERAKREAIADARLPVAGLGFEDGFVTIDGIVFAQLSDAEQLRISTALAMASRGKLAVVRIRDGSLLDEDSLAMVAEMADANDCQVWIERVDSSGKVGFVIEDGTVRDTGDHTGAPETKPAAKSRGKKVQP